MMSWGTVFIGYRQCLFRWSYASVVLHHLWLSWATGVAYVAPPSVCLFISLLSGDHDGDGDQKESPTETECPTLIRQVARRRVTQRPLDIPIKTFDYKVRGQRGGESRWSASGATQTQIVHNQSR